MSMFQTLKSLLRIFVISLDWVISLFVRIFFRRTVFIVILSEICIDEVVGCLFAFVGIVFSLQTVLIGIVLLRFFGITKILGIKHVERIPGS